MKAFTYLLLLLLLAVLGGTAYFYQYRYQPMAAEHARMKTGMPELDRAKTELKRYQERYSWLKPTAETLSVGLDKEVKAGTAEVVVADNGTVVINITEKVLYTPGSVTFAKDSPQTLAEIASLLKSLRDLKNKEIFIGNVTESVQPQGKGRRKMPGREARDLASARSLALIKYLEKNGVPQDSLVSTAYPSKGPDRGFRITDHKTMIVISYPPQPLREEAGTAAQTKPAAAAKGPVPTTVPLPVQPKPKPIPIQPAPPKQQ